MQSSTNYTQLLRSEREREKKTGLNQREKSKSQLYHSHLSCLPEGISVCPVMPLFSGKCLFRHEQLPKDLGTEDLSGASSFFFVWFLDFLLYRPRKQLGLRCQKGLGLTRRCYLKSQTFDSLLF